MARGRWWLVAAAAVLLGWGVMHSGTNPTSSSPSSGAAARDGAVASPGVPAASPSASPWNWSSYDPAQCAAQVRVYARQAGVDPQLVMAILYNEAYKPHDPAFERAWLQANPDAALGIANMHRATFDQTKQGSPFADSRWTDLPGNPALAVQSAAWYLHDLATDLPAHTVGPLSRDELLALGYNTGPDNMLAFARGVPLGPSARAYLDRLQGNWARAGAAVRG
ncbi:transglycosylase SLT domain-containing protein [Streptomyces sp. RB6PN25]|uniref:Transglycosylase SLT domain-containing protein n=1 Tax=Streptomyces humicola TaxID=2953240 RepID=A0ABT1PS36_9ACTN|nr:transglycosylase SLT domain-containing protein [Streptomyces humicola]MCQ4079943.1 transglycosylase SLT domain-containing protein [Streptomyces humicola]